MICICVVLRSEEQAVFGDAFIAKDEEVQHFVETVRSMANHVSWHNYQVVEPQWTFEILSEQCYRALEVVFAVDSGQRLERPHANRQVEWMKRALSSQFAGMGSSCMPSTCSGERYLRTPCTCRGSLQTNLHSSLQWTSAVNTGRICTR